MPLIIDTYNVLHTVGVLPPELAGIELKGLVDLLATSRYADEHITLVCDGEPSEAHRGIDDRGMAIHVRFAGGGKPADDLISQLVNLSTAPRRLSVVSSDHAVQRSARRRKCVVIGADEFLEHLATDAHLAGDGRRRSPKPAKPPASAMTDRQVDRWLKVFGIDDETAAVPAASSEVVAQPLEGVPSAAGERHHEESVDVADLTKVTNAPESADSGQSDSTAAATIRSIVPPSLIEQAEQLWRREFGERPSPAQPPMQSDTPPVRSSHDARPPEAGSAAQAESNDPANPLDDIDSLDMGRILPDDGLTKRWKRGSATDEDRAK